MLYSSDVFVSVCAETERSACMVRPPELRREKCCSAQESLYVAIASASLFLADGIMVVYGELMDRMGPRWCMGVAASLLW